MCGIIGTTDVSKSSKNFEEAFKTIFHRGPDNHNYIKTENFIFGHARLAIIDLDERSNQPFVYEFNSEKITIVFNGEIYNFLELKKILEEKNYIFKTTSDTEVVCASFLEWGIECFDYFEGMWALGLYNHKNNQFLLSRDRVGKKPLYYTFENNHVSFSSSIWGVSKLENKKAISSQGLQLYFALGFTPDNYSVLEGIHKLEPGKTLLFDRTKTSVELLNTRISVFKKLDSKNYSINELIYKSVQKRIISDVPIATLMSGGVDSTIVTKLTKENQSKAKTYFVDFEDKKMSEFFWADYLSKRNKINLNRVFLQDKELDVAFQQYAEVYEEPFADYSGIPSIAIFKKVAQEFKVVLTGDGGDELFYGYPHYFKKWLLRLLLKTNKIFNLSRFTGDAVKQIINGSQDEFEGNYLKNHAIVAPFAFDYINNRFNTVIKKEKSFLKGIIQYDREFNNLPEKYLVKTDRASMFSGIEVRSPFLDEVLLEKVRTKPVFLLFTPFISKLYLKLLYFRCFGLKYFLSKKSGFTPPVETLRNQYFKESDYEVLKEKLQDVDQIFYKEIQNLTYQNLLKDKILFDRFFFFNIWFQKTYLKNS
ncbi:MAG: asparagine synthase (glutamine-hydrolyzing) [Limnohabitans sp.]|nr:asparagine synthase (glutamine-hydrolyzing) [Limnohabitans sp.]